MKENKFINFYIMNLNWIILVFLFQKKSIWWEIVCLALYKLIEQNWRVCQTIFDVWTVMLIKNVRIRVCGSWIWCDLELNYIKYCRLQFIKGIITDDQTFGLHLLFCILAINFTLVNFNITFHAAGTTNHTKPSICIENCWKEP